MYEKMKPGVSEYGHLENVNRKINSHIHSEVSVKTILLFEFCATLEILICFILIKRFPNDHKRYSSSLQVSILHSVAPSYKILLNNLWEP